MSDFVERAFLLVRQGRYELAEKELRSAIQDDSIGSTGYSLLALCVMRQDRLEEASRLAERGIELDPNDGFGHYAMALVKLDSQRISEAESSIQRSIELDPEDATYRAILAKVRLSQQRWSDAAEAAEDGLRIDAEHELCTDIKGIALTKMGRAPEAAEEIESALQKNPENSTAHANKGWLLLHGGRGREGIVHFREALRLDPTDEYARAGLVEALKSRSRLYGWLLGGALWVTRFSRKTQIYMFLGLFVVYRILRSAAKKNPELAPYVLPVTIAFNLIWLSFWFGRPFFNLLLRLNREGRLALSAEQTRESSVFGFLFGATLVCIGFYSAGYPLALGPAIYFAGLLFPSMSYFDCEPGWPRRTMAWASFILAGMGITGVVVLSLQLVDLFFAIGTIFVIGVLACMLAGPFLSLVNPKR